MLWAGPSLFVPYCSTAISPQLFQPNSHIQGYNVLAPPHGSQERVLQAVGIDLAFWVQLFMENPAMGVARGTAGMKHIGPAGFWFGT